MLATIQLVFTDDERVALAGFLAGYRGLTCEAYALDLRQFASWCRARATVTRRLSTIAGFYKYAVDEELLDRSPAAYVRRPRVDCEPMPSPLP
jgi:site-specific recombinase XerD